MAIYWVDPYIASTNGGINGTTSTSTTVGNGSYTTPWRIVDIQNSAVYLPALVDGDEVRFKGLSEDTFFPSGNVRTFTVNTSGTNITSYTPNASDSEKLIRVKDARGDIFYTKLYGSQQLYTWNQPNFWAAVYPILDNTYGYYYFNTNYSINAWTSNTPLFNGINKFITITSGWTSQTVQGGVTVIDAMSNIYGGDVNYGSNSEAQYYRLTWNCPELIITNWQNQSMNICGNSVNIKAMAPYAYQPGYQMAIYSGASNSTYWRANSGNITLGTSCTGGYTYIYANGNTGSSFTVNVPYLVIGYQGTLNAYSYGSQPTATVIMNKYYAFYGFNLNSNYANQPLNFNLTSNWSFLSRSTNNTLTINTNFNVTENVASTIYTAQPANSSGLYVNTFGYLTAPSTNQSVVSPQAVTVYSNSASILKVSTFGQQYFKAFIKNYFIENAGETLETVSTSPGKWTVTSPFGSPYKINVLLEPQSFKPVQFMSPTSANYDTAVVYNSNKFSGALTWKIFGTSNGGTYADTYTLPLPSYSSADLTFTGNFTTTASPGITLTVTLYGYSVSSSNTINLGTATINTVGTAITATRVLTSSALSSNNITSLYAVISVAKTSSTTSEIAINSLTVT